MYRSRLKQKCNGFGVMNGLRVWSIRIWHKPARLQIKDVTRAMSMPDKKKNVDDSFGSRVMIVFDDIFKDTRFAGMLVLKGHRLSIAVESPVYNLSLSTLHFDCRRFEIEVRKHLDTVIRLFEFRDGKEDEVYLIFHTIQLRNNWLYTFKNIGMTIYDENDHVDRQKRVQFMRSSVSMPTIPTYSK